MSKSYEHSFSKEIYAYYNTGPLSKSFPKDSPIRSFRELYQTNTSIRRIYDIAIESLFSHSTKDAIFYADKLITLTNGHPVLLYLLGECYYQNQDFKKVHSLF